jgi:hypothetical protein
MNEWPAVTSSPKTSVTKVMFHDGAVLHTKKGHDLVRARSNAEPYYANFDTETWDHAPNLTDFRPYRHAVVGGKRKADDNYRYAKIAALISGHLAQIKASDSDDSSDSEDPPDSDDSVI